MRELGKSTRGQPVRRRSRSRPPDTLKRSDYFRGLQRRLYFQDGAPTDAQRDEIFQSGKAVVVVTCSMHATEVGASQMALELVHRLATDDSPRVKHVLDNVIFLLVPSLNPDGQMMVVDWYNKNLGTEFESSPMPWLYQKYVGHDNNRDMYMFTQVESQLTAKLLWHDWFPSVWLDEHQHGLERRAHLRDAGDRPDQPERAPAHLPLERPLRPGAGRGARGRGQRRHHLQLHLHELLAGRDGVERLVAQPGGPAHRDGVGAHRVAHRAAARAAGPAARAGGRGRAQAAARGSGDPAALPPPTDVMPRTEYPRPWLGGRWTLRDIVDYELIATMATLEYAADRRETLLRQIYEVNRATVEAGRKGDPAAIVITPDTQHDPLAAYRLVDRLQIAGVKVYRADAAFKADEQELPGRHVRRADDAGLRAVREGPAREADVSRGAALTHVAARGALRRHRLVAGPVARRRRDVREEPPARGPGPRAGGGVAQARRRR